MSQSGRAIEKSKKTKLKPKTGDLTSHSSGHQGMLLDAIRTPPKKEPVQLLGESPVKKLKATTTPVADHLTGPHGEAH